MHPVISYQTNQAAVIRARRNRFCGVVMLLSILSQYCHAQESSKAMIDLIRTETSQYEKFRSEGKSAAEASYWAAKLRYDLSPQFLNQIEDLRRSELRAALVPQTIASERAVAYRTELERREIEKFQKAEAEWNSYRELLRKSDQVHSETVESRRMFAIFIGVMALVGTIVLISRRSRKSQNQS